MRDKRRTTRANEMHYFFARLSFSTILPRAPAHRQGFKCPSFVAALNCASPGPS